jgi:hypothetical protein
MKRIKIFFSLLALSVFWPLTVKAFCPVCTVAVGAGLGFSRWLGIDDTVSSLWVGGLLIAVSAWTVDWLRKKKINFLGMAALTYFLYYAIVFVPFYFTGFIGHPFNRLWNVDKIVLGTAIGSVFFFAMGAWYNQMKKKNNGHAYFPFQKVVMPVGVLLILSLVFYFITKN